ncbi:MAG: hypothetical protein JNM68_01300, partial [Dinghuibacter sp.]|nr:hypothetical protein [Dinghuibacter sp.]
MAGWKAHIQALRTDRQAWLLLGVFAVVQLFLLSKYGVVTTLEAEKYIREGGLLAQGNGLSESRFIFYLPVILLVAFCRLLHLPLAGVVLVQILVAGVALYTFYRTAQLLVSQKWALGVSLFLALCIPLQQWNVYIYSDSLFISISIIFFSLLVRVANGQTYPVWLLPVMGITWGLARPAGILFIVPLFVLLFMLNKQNRWYVAGGFAGLLLVLFAASYYF